MVVGLGDAPRESIEDQSHTSSGYSFSVWSDGEKLGILKNHKQIAKRGGWKRLVIIIAMIIAFIIALAVGLAVGLKKKSSGGSNRYVQRFHQLDRASKHTTSLLSPTILLFTDLP